MTVAAGNSVTSRRGMAPPIIVLGFLKIGKINADQLSKTIKT